MNRLRDKLTPKLILEGTRLTHKTDIAFLLNEHPRFVGPRRYRYHSPLISAEWCAFTPYPWGRSLINYASNEESLAMETYATWVRLFELQRHYSWIIDRFHISTRAYQLTARGTDIDFGWLEERVAPLGFHLALIVRNEASFAVAREQRLAVSGKPEQYDDLPAFVREQALMRELVRGSLLHVREFDISDDDVARVADEIVDWMAATGGLWAPGELDRWVPDA